MEQDKDSRVVVISDGDFVRNDIDRRTRQPIELGYDRFMRVRFGNKDFALNIIDYLLDETGLLTVRAKEVALRPLDRVRIKQERLPWQLFNIITPVVLVLLYGVLRYLHRKRKFEKSDA